MQQTFSTLYENLLETYRISKQLKHFKKYKKLQAACKIWTHPIFFIFSKLYKQHTKLNMAHLFHLLQSFACCIQKLNAETKVKLCVFYMQQTQNDRKRHISSLTKSYMQHRKSEGSTLVSFSTNFYMLHPKNESKWKGQIVRFLYAANKMWQQRKYFKSYKILNAA